MTVSHVRPQISRARKIITRVIVFLLLGAIVNVAVAWGFAASWSLISSSQSAEKYLGQMKSWSVQRFEHVGLIRTESGYWYGMKEGDDSERAPCDLIPRHSNLKNVEMDRPSVLSQMEWEVLAGWPLLCMGGLKRNEFHGASGQYDQEVIMLALPIGPSTAHQQFRSSGAFRQKLLPLRPIWPNFAINTIFYAAILWMMFAIPGVLRRKRRLARGLCPACAYPIGTSPVCTECGGPVTLHHS